MYSLRFARPIFGYRQQFVSELVDSIAETIKKRLVQVELTACSNVDIH